MELRPLQNWGLCVCSVKLVGQVRINELLEQLKYAQVSGYFEREETLTALFGVSHFFTKNVEGAWFSSRRPGSTAVFGHCIA